MNLNIGTEPALGLAVLLVIVATLTYVFEIPQPNNNDKK